MAQSPDPASWSGPRSVEGGDRGPHPSSLLPRRRGRRPRHLKLLLITALLWIGFDQVTKVIVRESLAVGEHERLAPFFRFSHIQNDGGAFGLFQGSNGFLAVTAVIAVAVILVYLVFPPVDHWLARVGMALILGGAVGNLLDRLYQGHVTDFVNFSHFPAFNVADAGINIGVAAIVIALLVAEARRAPRPG